MRIVHLLKRRRSRTLITGTPTAVEVQADVELVAAVAVVMPVAEVAAVADVVVVVAAVAPFLVRVKTSSENSTY